MSLAAVRTHRHQPAPARASTAPLARGSRRAPSDLSMRLVRPTVQTKLEVNQPGDRFERQADQVANRVMRQAAAPEEQEEIRLAQNPRQVQRAAQPEEPCIECAQHPRGVQRQSAAGAPSIGPRAAATIQSPGPGQPLAPGIRRRIEPQLGVDLGHVQVHTDARAAHAARSLHATAFTYQNHIFTQRPSSSADLGLMAHEATHVVQQGAAGPQAQRAPDIQRFSVSDLASDAGAAFDAAAGAVLDTAGEVIATGADVLWELVRQYAPEALIQLIEAIQAAGGFAAYLKQLVTSTFDGVFDALGTDEETREQLFGTMAMFRDLIGAALEIQIGMLTGDCGPLFAAVSRLGEVVGQAAGEAWDSIAAFFRPVGEFFGQLWQEFGAPVMDWLSTMAGDAWADIQQLGANIWSWAEPVRSAPAGAWDWVKEQLGLGAEGDSEGGLVQWVQGLLAEVWAEVQAELAPVIEPVRAFADRVMEIIPLDAILNLRETVQGWLDRVSQMAQTMATEGQDTSAGVVQNQDTLRDELLPAVLQAIQDLRAGLVSAGEWVSGKIGAVALAVTGCISSLRGSELLGPFAGALDWIEASVTTLAEWEQTAVVGLFTLIGDGLVYLSGFVEPVLKVLQQLGAVLGDLMGELPALVFGPVWLIIPDCIRNPIKDFILNYILRAIPIFGQLFESDFWALVQETALRVLRQVFVDGDLFGAAWTYFSALLTLLNIPPQLIPAILGNAAAVFGDILADPIGFFIHLLEAMKQGFVQFFVNSPAHLFSGALEWLFGQVSEAGIARPPDFSLSSLFGLVLDILGLSKNHVLDRLEAKMDPEGFKLLLDTFESLSGVWRWVTILMDEGLPGIWREIQSQLSDLATMVIGSVVSWLSEKVMLEGMRWLVGFFDPTVLSTVVNSLILLYRAFESAVQYTHELLEMLNTALEGIGGIARGELDAAAGALERSLADGLPVAIGFTMDALGLGNLGERISETVKGIRERVDAALDWLIDGTIQGGQAILGAVEAGVQAVIGWWKASRTFEVADGKTHTLFFKGDENSAVLMVKSSEMPFSDFVNRAQKDDDAKKITAKAEALRLAGLIDVEKSTPPTGSTPEQIEKARSAKVTKINDLLEQLVPHTFILFDATIPDSFAGAVNPPADSVHGFGVSMSVKPLTNKNRQEGSPPTSAGNPIYAALNERRESAGGVSYYIKGHLLNQKLGGPGGWPNLTPLSRSGNAQHEVQVESTIKRTVDLPAVVEYNVVPNYSPRGDKATLLNQINSSGETAEARRIKSAIVTAEDWVPQTLHIEAYLLDESLNRKGKIISQTLVNPVERSYDRYYLSSSPRPIPINLSLAGKEQLAVFLGPVLAEKLEEAREDEFESEGITRFSSYRQIGELVPEIGEDQIKALSDAKHITLY